MQHSPDNRVIIKSLFININKFDLDFFTKTDRKLTRKLLGFLFPIIS